MPSFLLRELGRGDGAVQAAGWPGVGRWEQSYGAEAAATAGCSSIVDNSNCATTVLRRLVYRTYAHAREPWLASVNSTSNSSLDIVLQLAKRTLALTQRAQSFAADDAGCIVLPPLARRTPRTQAPQYSCTALINNRRSNQKACTSRPANAEAMTPAEQRLAYLRSRRLRQTSCATRKTSGSRRRRRPRRRRSKD